MADPGHQKLFCLATSVTAVQVTSMNGPHSRAGTPELALPGPVLCAAPHKVTSFEELTPVLV